MRIAAIFLLVCSCFFGWYSFEVFEAAKSSMHEIYASIVMLCGVLLFVGSVVVDALGILNKTIQSGSNVASVKGDSGGKETAARKAQQTAREKQNWSGKPEEARVSGTKEVPRKPDQSSRARDAWIQP